jgi:cytochrome P450
MSPDGGALIADPAAYAAGVPFREFAQRREVGAVTWADEPARGCRTSTGSAPARRGPGFWAVTRYAEVDAALRAPAVYSSELGGAFIADPQSAADLDRARQLMINMDDPRHARIRKLVSATFTPRSLTSMRASIDAHAHRLVQRLIAAGSFECVRDLAAELPLLVLADLLGLPAADRGLLYDWSNNLVGFDDPQFGGGDVDIYRDTFKAAFSYARALRTERSKNPGDDLMSRLSVIKVDGERLSDQAFCSTFLLLIVAGNETTRHLISGSLKTLADFRDERDRLVADPGLLSTAVPELIRFVSPIMQFRRTAVTDTELGGQRISAGDKLVLYFVSANRDSRVFARPDQLDLGRHPNPHLSFGVGPHYCLGSHLAMHELSSVLTALLPYLGRLEPAGPMVRLASNFMNGIKEMPVRLQATAPPLPA